MMRRSFIGCSGVLVLKNILKVQLAIFMQYFSNSSFPFAADMAVMILNVGGIACSSESFAMESVTKTQ